MDSIQQITAWRRACESATDWAGERGQQQAAVDRDARKKVRALERELQRKEKALTETAALPPGQIVPRLADKGGYLVSESTFYRVLRAHDLQHHRGRAKVP